MDDDLSLLATYSSGQYVVVSTEESQEKLAILGFFGTSAEHATRKGTDKRGPVDCLLANFKHDSDSGSTTLLTLHEAYFLAYGLGCLSISSQNLEKLSLQTCWGQFRESYKGLNVQLDFAIEYGVYHYFRSRGWIVKSGENYGTNFLLYRDKPSVEHSKYAVLIMSENEGIKPYDWQSLLTFQRVIQSVGKELLLVFIENPSVVSDDPRCIERIKIACTIFRSHSGTTDGSIDRTTVEQ